MSANSTGEGKGLSAALELLEQCRPTHFDFSGALVHHEKSSGNELQFDPSCPQCVIPKAIALLREAQPADSALRLKLAELIAVIPHNAHGRTDSEPRRCLRPEKCHRCQLSTLLTEESSNEQA